MSDTIKKQSRKKERNIIYRIIYRTNYFFDELQLKIDGFDGGTGGGAIFIVEVLTLLGEPANKEFNAISSSSLLASNA